MNIKYHKWLELKVTNRYFKGSICPVLSLLPIEETAVALKNYNVLIRKNDNIFSFYCGTEAETFDITNELSGLKKLYFQVLTEDSLFFNYTEIPKLNQPELFLFQNYKDSSQLQIEAYVTDDDMMDLALLSLDTQYRDNCIGILHLNLDKGINTATEPLQFTIDFEARAIYWQYQVIVSDSRRIKVSSMEIIGSQDEVYAGPIEETLIGGQIANVFTSSKPLKLQKELLKNPELKLSYTDKFSNQNKEMKIKLPNPNPVYLKTYYNQENEKSFCTTTIVYV